MAAPTTVRAAEALARDIDPEPWGNQFGRIRKSHYTGEQIVAELKEVGVDTSTATISRLEKLTEPPEPKAQRVVAAVVFVLCDVHPERLGISLDELPLKVYANLFGAPDDPSGLEITPRACNAQVLPPRARRTKAPSIAA